MEANEGGSASLNIITIDLDKVINDLFEASYIEQPRPNQYGGDALELCNVVKLGKAIEIINDNKVINN